MAKLGSVWIGVLGVVGGAVACSPIVDIEPGPDVCNVVEDCADRASACRKVACELGACVVELALEGAPVEEQRRGDCQVAVCNGAGEVTTIPREDDIPDDANACTIDACAGATPVHTATISCLCGDGSVSGDETCDDGGRTGGDGCSADCQVERVLQVAAGFGHTCALLSGGSVKCWGQNDHGQLGLGDTEDRGDAPQEMGRNLPAVDLGTGKTARAIAAGGAHTCALLDDGSVKCWGFKRFGILPGQMGDDLPAIDLGPSETALSISAGDFDVCAVLGDGGILCWYGPEPGEYIRAVNLGADTAASAVSVGHDHVCAVLGDGSVQCWGDNTYFQLGTTCDGCTTTSTPVAARIGAGETATAVSAATYHTCALLGGGRVKCWGTDVERQLGITDEAGQPISGTTRDLGDALPALDLGTGRTATAIATGVAHSCALLDDGDVTCWGSGPAAGLREGQSTAAMGDHLRTIQLGAGKTARSIAAGHGHTCALLDDGSVTCWGENDQGQLGLGGSPRGGTGALPTVKLFGDAW